MIDVEDLIALVRNYNPRTNDDLIRRAYAYGINMHEGQLRQSGEPYFTHPVAVAAILTEQRLDDATIVTALLHDTIEDTDTTHEALHDLFGGLVASLVLELTSDLDQIKKVGLVDVDAEYMGTAGEFKCFEAVKVS
jgi:GTP pyrophosphokinase/guanosine-3',5'-bis(diphosphate) 3'-pyrophosphohydrolase